MKEHIRKTHLCKKAQKALLRWYEAENIDGIKSNRSIAPTEISKEINELSPFLQQCMAHKDSFDSRISIEEDRIDSKHQEYQNYLLSKQLEFKKYRLNIFYLNHYALKIQHCIFKLSILKKLKAAKCPCCNKPRNPKKKVKRTGHRIDCACLKCSSLLMKNLLQLKSKSVKNARSEKLNNTSASNSSIEQKDLSTASEKSKKEETKHFDALEAYGQPNHLFEIPKKIGRSTFIYDSEIMNNSRSVQNSSNTHNISSETFENYTKKQSRTDSRQPKNLSRQRGTKGSSKDRHSMIYKQKVFSAERDFLNSSSSPKSKNCPSNFRSIGYEEPKDFAKRRNSGAHTRTNKAVNSISAIINTKEMTIKVSQNQGTTSVKKSQNNKISKGKKSNHICNKFEHSVLSKKSNYNGYNLSQDYSFALKALGTKKLQNSKSSGKLNKKLISQRSNDQRKKSKGGSKTISKNPSVSKKRTKSSNRVKENDFKNVLKPAQDNNISSEVGIHTRKSEKFHLNPLREEFTYEKEILKPLIAPQNEAILKENYSKTAHKIVNRHRGVREETYSPHSVVLQENGLSKITCNIFKSHEGGDSRKSSNSSKISSSEKHPHKLSQNQNSKYVKKQKKISKYNKSLMAYEGVRKVTEYTPKLETDEAEYSPDNLEVYTKKSEHLTYQKPIRSQDIDQENEIQVVSSLNSSRTMTKEVCEDSSAPKDEEIRVRNTPTPDTDTNKIEKILPDSYEATEKPVKNMNNLLSMSNEIFDVMDSQHLDGDLASSLSSQTSQPDYDNMAMEAWEEVDKIKEDKPQKQVKLHNYTTPESNWVDDYNKGFPSKIKTNDIDVIEEDIENEIDSDYSITLNAKNNQKDFPDSLANTDSEGEIDFLRISKDAL
ncbi:unnamed protein product [Moneuplotes crassus]|uniref:Uncharacterized protein n=1 Tax=Euplotes crassus TaxID=5936 RepID=A0AAD1XS45_EUPCR|nr:unnamed protein product [Moneuplotes crassus]